MALNIAEIINAVHGVHCHQCYDLSISYHQCHKVTKSLNRYPCICLYLCVCACFCLLSSPLINRWKKSQLCGIPLKCFHGSDYSWTSWSTVNVTNRVVLELKNTILTFISPSPPMRRKKLPWLCSFSDVLYFFSLIWKRNWGIEEYHLDLQRHCIVHSAFWYRL